LKDEISYIALLFEDEEPKIRSLVDLFFFQINKKDPDKIYNLVIPAISILSQTK